MQSKQELLDFLKELLDLEQIPSIIDSQITRYVRENKYTYKNIARAAYFYFEVRKSEYIPRYGIGIVPHVIDEAISYFENQLRKEEFYRQQGRILAQKTDRDTIEVKPTKVKRRGIVTMDITKIK